MPSTLRLKSSALRSPTLQNRGRPRGLLRMGGSPRSFPNPPLTQRALWLKMMETNNIYLGDCLDVMKRIADGSVDMILCDLPYGVLHKDNPNAQWDRIIPFGPLWEQYRRVTLVKPGYDGHHATFPIDIPCNCIRLGCREHGVVLDPFIGSGTTGVAAARLKRDFIGFELNVEYAKSASERVEKELREPMLF